MGADLLLMWVPVPEGDPDQVKTELYAKVTTFSDERLADIAELLGLDAELLPGPDDEEAETNAEWKAEAAEQAEEIRARIREGIDLLFVPEREMPRDVTWGILGGRKYLFCGGTSWGDDPGDSWGAFQALLESDLLSATPRPEPEILALYTTEDAEAILGRDLRGDEASSIRKSLEYALAEPFHDAVLATADPERDIPIGGFTYEWKQIRTEPFDAPEFYEPGTIVTIHLGKKWVSVDRDGETRWRFEPEGGGPAEVLEKAEDFRERFPDGNLPDNVDGTNQPGWVCDNNPWFDLYSDEGDHLDDVSHDLDEAIAGAEAALQEGW